MVLLIYTTYTSVDNAFQEIFCAKVSKGGIKSLIIPSAEEQISPFLGYLSN